MLSPWLAQHPLWWFGLLLVFGLVVGSFLNVVILRLPRILEQQWRADCESLLAGAEAPAPAADTPAFSLAYPPSHCPRCAAPIRPWHNIPLLSYLLLRGRCASCEGPISARYPVVEAATGAVTLATGLVLGPTVLAAGGIVLCWALIALTAIDIEHQLLPDDITLPLLWAGLLFNLGPGDVAIADAVLGAAAGYLLLWSIYWLFRLLTGKEGMGYGDFKLLAALGAWLGWQALPLVILLSSLVGAVVGMAGILLLKRGRDVPIPFGPYLAAAGWLALLWGEPLVAAWFGLLQP